MFYSSFFKNKRAGEYEPICSQISTRAMAGGDVDRATCWALTSPGCGWCVGALGDEHRALGRYCSPSPPSHQRLTWLTPDVDISHIYAWIRKYLCSNSQTHLFCRVRVRERAAAKQSRLSVARGLWRQICLNAFIVSREGRDAGREMERRAEGRCGLPRRTGTSAEVAAGAAPSPVGLLRLCRRRPLLQPANSRLY